MATVPRTKTLIALPDGYIESYADDLNQSSPLGRSIAARCENIINDLGGLENLSTVKQSLVKRFLWLETMIESVEYRVSQGEAADIGAWTQLINSWIGLSRQLGLDRRSRTVRGVQEHLAGKAGRARKTVAVGSPTA